MNHKSKLDTWLNHVIEAGWLAALVVAPLFFNVFSSRVFEPDKISLIRTIALLMLLAWLVKLVSSGQGWLPAFPSLDTQNQTGEGDGAQSSDAGPSLSKPWKIPLLVPILLLVIVYLISTTFSVARFVSWWGSYQRLQGTYTFLSYIIIALLTIAHLRRPIQIRRIQHAIIITSLPIAIYGIVQHYGIDPLPWGGDVTRRVASNAGNAIFLSAYLIMALFITLERIYSSFAFLLGFKGDSHTDSQDFPTALAGGAYLFVLMVQVLAIFWTQSRGPLLGLLAGLYLFVLLLISALRPKHFRILTGGWIGMGLLGVIALILLNTTTAFSSLTSISSLRRLSTLLDLESNTAQVRVLIWQGAAEMVTPHQPLIFPDGNLDAINAVRPLVGYGPEAMWIAYNPFYPPELAHHEARNASPDRSHNETWDALVITGLLGFLAYIALFISIFYWSLRWLGLLINRRDNYLFGGLLLVLGLGIVIVFYLYDGSWRFFGVALPAGLMLGLGIYVTIAAFLHPHLRPNSTELPQQLLIATLLATTAAHFVEIHFGIAIAATRTYFWIQTAMLLVLGMRWALPEPFAAAQAIDPSSQRSATAEPRASGKARRRRGRSTRAARSRSAFDHLPAVPATVMTDLLIFLTFVFIYTTNSAGVNSSFTVLIDSISTRSDGSGSAAIFFLMLFTWIVAATVGLAATSLQQNHSPGIGWWIRGYALHAAIVWGGWLVYGFIQGSRLLPAAGGSVLDEQLAHVAAHFAIYTWILIAWILGAGVVFAWPWLRERRLPSAGKLALSLGVGVVLTIGVFFIVSTVNIALVRADIIYKQGQQFDSQGNWPSSIELYRRALSARRTEDHYMLFLGRALLEQAKRAPAEGVNPFGEDPSIEDVISLTPEAVSQMGRYDLLRVAEVVLLEAQRVNPLNTDHTANLARLYRSWADLSIDDAELQQAMLDKSIASYNMAVQLSPNAAHLWNEKGNAHQARNEPEEAEAAYLYSLSLDPQYDQTYLYLATFYEHSQQYEKEIERLEEGILELPRNPHLYSYLGVAKARSGDLQGSVDANLRVLELQPNNAGAMRNLALLYRDMDLVEEAIPWAENAIALTNPASVNEVKTLRQLAAQLYQTQGRADQVITQYEQMRQVDPNDASLLNTLYNLYLADGNSNQAIEVLQMLASLEPENYQHPLAIAQLLQEVSQTENALAFANQALALAPDDQKVAISQFIDSLAVGSE